MCMFNRFSNEKNLCLSSLFFIYVKLPHTLLVILDIISKVKEFEYQFHLFGKITDKLRV